MMPTRLALAGVIVGGALALPAMLGAAACSSSSSGNGNPFVDSGSTDTFSFEGSGEAGVQALKPWPPPGDSCQRTDPNCPGDPGANGIYVTISGEVNALTGYPFPPTNPAQDTYMVDGWQIHIDAYIVVVDNVVLWDSPNQVPSDPSRHGAQVAHLDGPFAVDLHKGGHILGQGGGNEEATPIGTITNQNDNGNAAFDPTKTYGFGFSTVPATYGAYGVNLDSIDLGYYAAMVENGYSVFYAGTAQWHGGKSAFGCTQTNAGSPPDAGVILVGDAGVATEVDGGYNFDNLPWVAPDGTNPVMTFRIGFSTPTNYVNCQNMALQGAPNPNEDFPRGIQVSTSQSVVAQITLHMDHPFWESFAENSPVHWDAIAAQYVGQSSPTVKAEDMKGVAFYAFTDKVGTPLPWHNCSGTFYTPPGNGQMFFSTLSVPVNPQGTCTGIVGQDYTQDNCPAIRDYYDYLRYTQSTQGHLNSQGLCYIDRRYPAPAGGS
jgi:hypothetical protein